MNRSTAPAAMTPEQLKQALAKPNKVQCARCGHTRVEHSHLGPCTIHWCECDEFKSPHKYRNEPVVVDSIHFDSRKEARRWHNLQLAQQAGEIWNLRRQVRYELHCPGGLKVATYVADHVYERDKQTIVEDVKSTATRKLPMYRLKKRWMQLEHGITVQEW